MDSVSDIFAQYIANENVRVPINILLFNMALAIILSVVLEYTYSKCGYSLSNRKAFAKNFLLMSLTTLLIIIVVKSSLALSLGLVGALSVIRFRSAIKEPGELTYLFLATSVGIGLGANQTAITVVAFMVIVTAIWVRHWIVGKEEFQNLFLVISSNKPAKVTLDAVLAILRKEVDAVDLRRYESNSKLLEASFLVELDNPSVLEKIKKQLQKIDRQVHVTFVDNKQIT